MVSLVCRCFFPVSGAMLTTLTLAMTQKSATMGLPIIGLVRPVGVSVLLLGPPIFNHKAISVALPTYPK